MTDITIIKALNKHLEAVFPLGNTLRLWEINAPSHSVKYTLVCHMNRLRKVKEKMDLTAQLEISKETTDSMILLIRQMMDTIKGIISITNDTRLEENLTEWQTLLKAFLND